MRVARMKLSACECYYHVMNRLSGPRDEYPLDEVDKEFAFQLFGRLMNYYLIEPVSMAWMDNHWHGVLYVSNELPTAETIAERHNAYYGKTRPELSAADRERCQAVGEEMMDISHMVGVFLQKFSVYYNRSYNRRGRLWADRFKSVILDGENALWACVKYIELNPVRAGLVNDPADYRFCSWGRFCGGGTHPFGDNFVRHLKRSLGELGKQMSDAEVIGLFRSEVARTQAVEAGMTGEELDELVEEAKKPERIQVRFLRRTRHWTDGAIIGSRAFVREIACQFHDRDRVERKRLSEGADAEGRRLTCFRVLRQAVS